MSYFASWNNALLAAIALHLALIGFLMHDQSQNQPPTELALAKDKHHQQETSVAQRETIVEAVSVDANAVEKAVQQMKEKQAEKEKLQARKQMELKRAAQQAIAQRKAEEKKLQQIKQQAARHEADRQKQLVEEQKRLAEVAKQRALAEKRFNELKQKQLEEQKIAEAKAARERAQREKAKEEQQLAERKAREAEEAKKKQLMAGVVDRYKSMIVSSISEHWILPEHTNDQLSSQFRIRLAPDGSVLDVVLTRGSGDAVLDLSAKNAIYKASPLPVPSEPEAFAIFREIVLTVRPEQVRG